MQNKQQLIDYLVSLDAKRRTPEMIEKIMQYGDAGLGRRTVVAETGYGEETARKVLRAYRVWQVAQIGASAVEAVTARNSDNVVSDDDAGEPDGKEWLSEQEFFYNPTTDVYVVFLKTSPKPLVVPGARHRDIVRAYSNWDGSPASINEMCRTFSLPRHWFNEYRKIFSLTHDKEPFSDEEIMDRSVDDLVEDALQMKRLGLHQKFEKKKWADIKRDADSWNTWVELEKPKLQEYIASVGRKAPATIDSLPVADSPFAVVFSPFNDAHVGKYASKYETRSPYNRDIARERILRATHEVIRRVLLFGRPEKWIIPIGSDLTHVDNPFGNTTKGTPQDTDGTFKEIRRAVNTIVIEVLDLLLPIAPVYAVFEEGNHDAAASFETSMFVEAWYRTDDRLTIDTAMTPRKYVSYGQPGTETMIAIDHGDRMKHDTLVTKMAHEERGMWARCKYHMALVAHKHAVWMSEISGVMVCQRPSVSGSDRWHENAGYVGNTPAVAAYLIDAVHGPINQIFAPVG